MVVKEVPAVWWNLKKWGFSTLTGISLGMCPANERHRYNVTKSLICWMHTGAEQCGNGFHILKITFILLIIEWHRGDWINLLTIADAPDSLIATVGINIMLLEDNFCHAQLINVCLICCQNPGIMEPWLIMLHCEAYRLFATWAIDWLVFQWMLEKTTHWCFIRPCFCLLLGVSSVYTQPITGQVTEVTCPVIGWAQP